MPLVKPQYAVGGWGPVVDTLIDWYNANENGFTVADASVTDAKVAVGISADKLADGTSNKAFTAAERVKLAGVAPAASANASDAALRDRASHTGVQPSTSISDFAEAVQDVVGSMVTAGANVSLSYDDVAGTLTLNSTGGGGGSGLDAEGVRDTMAAALVGGTNITVTVNDAADTITFATTATVNSTDAQLRDRSTHTGTQSADTLTDGTTNKAYSATEKTKLSGIATGATANSTDAQLRDRATHTGTQSADTVVDGTTNKAYSSTEKTKLAGVATGATANSSDATLLARANHTGTQASTTISDFTEAVQDVVGALLAAGTNVTLSYNDASNSLTINSSGSGGLDAEAVRDAIGVALIGTGLIAVVANDAADTITITTTATQNSTDATLLSRANHTGTQSADTLTDGTTNKAFLATERTKLSGVAVGATANATDAQLRDRATHTGTQSADTLVDGSTNHAFTAADDTKLAGIATGATANSSDAQLRDRSTHTGTQSMSSILGSVWLPSDYGYLSWSLDPGTSGTSQLLNTGVLYLVGVKVPETATVTGVAVNVQSAGTGMANCYLGLYNASGTRLGVSADKSTEWATAGNSLGTFTGVSISAGLYYVGILCGSGTTAASVSRAASASTTNTGIAAFPFRSATTGSSLTALPASFTPASAAANGAAIFAAIKV